MYEVKILQHHIFLGLIQIKGIGFQTIYNFFHEGKKLSDLMVSHSLSEFSHLLGRAIDTAQSSLSDWDQFLHDLVENGKKYSEELEKDGISLLLFDDVKFPRFPEDMQMPIYWLFIQGNVENLHNKNALTLIGSRDCSLTGAFLAQTLLFGISQVSEPIVTISGLAAGIDQMVHDLSLYVGLPTIAVLGNGLLENYPTNSKELKKEIIESGGTVITEYFPTMKPTKDSFVRRNRIQAALANTVIPVEWKEKSGTAHTIRFAYEMKKQICFVETSACRQYFTEHALANSNAQRKYQGEIFVLPNAINDLVKKLGLSIDKKVVLTLEDRFVKKEIKEHENHEQMGFNF